MKRIAFILLSVLLTATLWAQEPPHELCVGNMGFASWLPPSNSNGLQGYRLWLDEIALGDVTETEFQVMTDTLVMGHEYTFSVAAVYLDEVSEAVSHNFPCEPCSHFAGPAYFKGAFVDENTVKLTWANYFVEPWTLGYGGSHITHPGAGYNNGWNVSALHDGLTAYGFNVNRNDSLMVMDKFDTPEGWTQGGIYGFRFYLYQDATPISTLTGVYMAIYDGDPLNGGQLIYGDLSQNIMARTYMNHTYRTSEDDFTETDRPISCIEAGMILEDILPGTYWFIVSFSGALNSGVYVVPRTSLGETTTGEARIYDPNKGWSPLIDPGTNTQQGLSFEIIGPGNGAALPISYTNIYRDGELIAQGIGPYEELYVDHNVPHGIHNYSIENIYADPGWWECPNKSCLQTIDVRPSYAPEDFQVETVQLDEEWTAHHLTWDKEDDIPQREDIKTYYEVYRKSITDGQFNLIGVVAKEESQEHYEYIDTVHNGIHYYRVNDYNIFPTGSCESEFAGRFGDCEGTDDVVSGEAQWNGFTDGASIGWGELHEGEFHYDDGVYMASTADMSNQIQWGIMVPFAWQNYNSFIRNVSLYIQFDGAYRVRIYEGFNQPETLVKEMMVQLTGPDQWHTVMLDEPYQMNNHIVWVMVSRTSVIQRPIPYAGNNGTSDDGRWICDNGYWYKTNIIDGSFMVRALYSNRMDAESLMQLAEPQYGFQHYNLYRSTDNVNYEQIAQIPYPPYNCHIDYFDPHDNSALECYYYQVTLTHHGIDGSYCETTPMLNTENPLIDWAEVCYTWNTNETTENKNLALYPNPTTGLLTIEMDDFGSAEVYDLIGRIIKQSQQPTLNLGGLPQGLYVVKVFDKKGKTTIRKIVKQ